MESVFYSMICRNICAARRVAAIHSVYVGIPIYICLRNYNYDHTARHLVLVLRNQPLETQRWIWLQFLGNWLAGSETLSFQTLRAAGQETFLVCKLVRNNNTRIT